MYIFTKLPHLKTNHGYMSYRKIFIYKRYIYIYTVRYMRWKCKNVQSMGQDISIANISDFDLEIVKQCK